MVVVVVGLPPRLKGASAVVQVVVKTVPVAVVVVVIVVWALGSADPRALGAGMAGQQCWCDCGLVGARCPWVPCCRVWWLC